MQISLLIQPTTEDLTAQSKWWGAPDLPENIEYPCQEGMPMTFICQIRCSDIAALDSKNLLPHSGMLYFFASIGEYLEGFDVGLHNGFGLWDNEAFKVIYSPTCENLSPLPVLWDDDDTPAFLPAEKIEFHTHEIDDGPSFKLLGQPYFTEVQEQFPDHISLLQIDELDRWNLRLCDCGMLNFLIKPSELKRQEWGKCKFHFYSF